MSAEPRRTAILGRHAGPARVLLCLAIAAKIAIVFVFARHILFVMDEFAQLGYAKYLGNGIFETVQPTKALGFAIYYKIAHLIGWDAVSIILAARMQTALLACATLVLIFSCVRTLGEDRGRALAIVLILLCFSNFMERIFRTISEPPALFFGVAALLVVLRGQPNKPRDILLAGVLSGIAFLTTQKAVYFNLALGLALLADAAMARRYFDGLKRGCWLVFGWTLPIAVYCFAFGGTDPLPIAESIVSGPLEIATRGDAEYGTLRGFLLQFLIRNAGLSALCFAGMALSFRHIDRLPQNRRIALVFSAVVIVLIFSHSQPWPYIFIMAVPFMAIWALVPLDRLAENSRQLAMAWVVLVLLIAMSFVANLRYLRFDNDTQLELVARADAMLDPGETYFDAVAMLPNRFEPTTLWLDRYYVLKTLREGKNSEAYEVLTHTPIKMILWSYRLTDVYPVIAPAVRHSYVGVAPNIRLAGRRLTLGEPVTFDVPFAGTYRLYDPAGRVLSGSIEVDGAAGGSSVALARGRKTITLREGPAEALLVPEGSYVGLFAPGDDNPDLFTGVYS